MDIGIERENGGVWAAVTGRVDGATAEEFHRTTTAALEQTDRFLVVDAAGVSFISSAGLRVILLLAKRLDGGRMVLCGLSPQVREVFSISGFDKIITIVADREAALDALPINAGR